MFRKLSIAASLIVAKERPGNNLNPDPKGIMINPKGRKFMEYYFAIITINKEAM